MGKKINVSVREIAEFSLSEKDINMSSSLRGSNIAAVEGTRYHLSFQTKMLEKYGKEKFQKEVYLEDLVENSIVTMNIAGRVDGILHVEEKDYDYCIYEVKTTTKDVNEILPAHNPEHLGQAQLYAYIYMKKYGLEKIGLNLLYINRENQDQISFEYVYSLEQVKKVYDKLTRIYLNYLTGIRKWHIIRDKSIAGLEFPYSYYRKGQKELIDESYNSIVDGIKLFATAPTGTGKTMGVLFPAIKALGEGHIDKIMYLTAKTVTAQVAKDAYNKLQEKGLNLRLLHLSAKEKMCPMEKMDCDPEKCPRAKHYYIRARKCIKEMLSEQFFDAPIIKAYADKYDICPFELSLDLTGYCDLIIGDYNYLFDPRVKLDRYFNKDNDLNFCYLIDEAHNLVERGREMFSCALSTENINLFKKSIKKDWKYLKESVNQLLHAMKISQREHFENMNEGFVALENPPLFLLEYVDTCINDIMLYDLNKIPDDKKEAFKDGMFNLIFFSKIASFYDSRYSTLYTNKKDNFEVKMMCLDPSMLLKESMDTGKASIIFSATLEPSNYYMNLLGADGDFDTYLSLPSPFPSENLEIKIVGDISTKYKERDMSYEKIALLLKQEFSKKIGNYMAFFPSYTYMKSVLDIFSQLNLQMDIVEQVPYMSDSERLDFLKRFDKYGEKTLVAFVVMGGLFGEGIDLVGEKLSGAVVIGPGLPTVGPERELIRKYFDDLNMNGFDYSYTFPGLNKVLQAAGRVIRSEEDKGFVLLVDSRFASNKYKSLFPKWWNYSSI